MAITAGWLIFNVIDNFINSPTLISIDTTEYPIHKVPFPALTICNMNKINVNHIPPSQVEVFGRERFDAEEWLSRVTSILDMVYAGCTEGLCSSEQEEDEHLTNQEIKKVIQLTAPSCEEMMFKCSWRGTNYPCSELFETHQTDFGFCCLFNAVYNVSREDEIRYSGAGDTNGLTVMIDARRYEYFMSNFLSVGFKLLVHGSHDEPEVGERGMAVPPGQEIFVAVGAEQTFTTKRAVEKFTPQKRNCFKEDEVKLQFTDTPIYTLANCLISHEAEELHKKCGCVAYYMPGNGELCHENDMPCLHNYLERLSKDFELSTHFWDNCLPACDETKYWTELSSSQFPSPELIRNDAFTDTFQAILERICFAVDKNNFGEWDDMIQPHCPMVTSGKTMELISTNATLSANLYDMAVQYAQENMAKVHFYFKTNSATRYKRDVVFTNDQLIANIGGLLGLFMGFSIVSVFELIYFFILNHFKGDTKGTQSVTPVTKQPG
ncbi:sodium channel protein Nach-like [Amphibalanus amphitrite]|uniref:sodium channel protein Nach-like n=1 Tax=Amphibalanus amphitrite TaxID=1232801 RepID=UPI001C923B64|nr:sodium channel protein Nach-like [Amphibalanus amphitrite]